MSSFHFIVFTVLGGLDLWNRGEIKRLQCAFVWSCILPAGIWAKFIYRSVNLYMPSSSWHILLIGRELQTCNSTRLFLSLHLAASFEASASLSTNLTLTSAEAFVFKLSDGRWKMKESRKNMAQRWSDSMAFVWNSVAEHGPLHTNILKTLFETQKHHLKKWHK